MLTYGVITNSLPSYHWKLKSKRANSAKWEKHLLYKLKFCVFPVNIKAQCIMKCIPILFGFFFPYSFQGTDIKVDEISMHTLLVSHLKFWDQKSQFSLVKDRNQVHPKLMVAMNINLCTYSHWDLRF